MKSQSLVQYFHTWCGARMQVRNVLLAARCKYGTQKKFLLLLRAFVERKIAQGPHNAYDDHIINDPCFLQRKKL